MFRFIKKQHSNGKYNITYRLIFCGSIFESGPTNNQYHGAMKEAHVSHYTTNNQKLEANNKKPKSYGNYS